MSKLLQHVKTELERAGLKGPTGEYDGMIYEAVVGLAEVFTKQGHSGGSAAQTLAIFNRVANWENLLPLTSNPDEWQDCAGMGGQAPNTLWQCKRNPAFFSKDAGQTWYSVNAER